MPETMQDSRPFAGQVAAEPYPFPLRGPLSPSDTALLVIDMQGDFCSPGGFMDRLGLDWQALHAPAAPIARLLAAFRAGGFLICHTRETFPPDRAGAGPNRLWRGADGQGPILGDAGPLGRHLIAGEEGWQIIPEVAPLPGETIFDKPGYGAFGTTAIDAHLRRHGIRNLVVTGVTSDCCVHLTVQEALDRGYDCLTVSDATAGAFPAAHADLILRIRRKGGVFGSTADTAAVLAALRQGSVGLG